MFPQQSAPIWREHIRDIIQAVIENRRKHEKQRQYMKEMDELLAKDPNAKIPPRKRGRPPSLSTQRKRLKARGCREEFERAVEEPKFQKDWYEDEEDSED
jgi:hypothetical protein